MPKELTDKLNEIIRSAERQLGEFAGAATTQGQYPLAKRAIEVAEVLNRLRGAPRPNAEEPHAPGRNAPRQAKGPNPRRKKARGRKRASGAPAELTTFRREGSMLVKRAESRQTGKAYEHKAPRGLVTAVTASLAKWNSTDPLLAVNELMAAVDETHGAAPGYQVYLVLAWLMTLGLVSKHGRSGYSVPSPQALVTDVETAWEGLNTR